MAYVVVDKDGSEWVYVNSPLKNYANETWQPDAFDEQYVNLPKGSIHKLIGRDLTWDDEPVELQSTIN